MDFAVKFVRKSDTFARICAVPFFFAVTFAAALLAFFIFFFIFALHSYILSPDILPLEMVPNIYQAISSISYIVIRLHTYFI